MNTQQLESGSLDLQSAIYRVALSLDAFLLNGIQYGLLQDIGFVDFLQKIAGTLASDLQSLAERSDGAPPPADVAEIVVTIRKRCQELIDLVTGLISFRSLPLPQVRLAVSQISARRSDCVRLIEELEARLHYPKSFYRTRPEHSAEAIDHFLAGLEGAFADEWIASHSVDASA